MKKFAGISLFIAVMVSAAGARADVVVPGVGAPKSANNGPTRGAETVANTDRPVTFGHEGQIMVSATTTANLSGDFGDQGGQRFNFNISPAGAYFLSDMVFVGGLFNIAYTNSGGQGTTNFEIGPTAGLHFPIAPAFSALPSLTLALGVIGDNNNGFTTNSTTFNINLDGTFAWHAVPHFSFIFGPYFHQEVGDIEISSIGINLGVLGWI